MEEESNSVLVGTDPITEAVVRFLQDNDAEDDTSSTDSSIIIRTFRVYGVLYAVSMILFTFLNWQYPRLFNVRSWSPLQKCKLAVNTTYDNCVSWFWQVFEVSDIEMHEQCGMDAVCFIRALRFGRNVVLMGCLNALWLIPMYVLEGRGEDNNTTSDLDIFQRISIGNIDPSSKRYIGTLIATYINFLYSMYLIMQEVSARACMREVDVLPQNEGVPHSHILIIIIIIPTVQMVHCPPPQMAERNLRPQLRRLRFWHPRQLPQ